MKQFLLLLLILFTTCFYFGGVGQPEPPYRSLYQRAENLYNAENPTTESDSLALQSYMQVIQLLKKDHAHDSVLADCYTKAAILQQLKGDDRAAIGLFNQALNVVDNNRALSDSLKYFPLLYCGSSYYTLFQFDSARHYYQQAEIIIDRFPHLPERERLYNKIGTLYYEEGNFHQSLNYFTKALSLLDTTKADNTFLMVNYYNNIAVTYKKLGRYQEALDAYQRLLPYRISQDGLRHNIATVYLDMHQPHKALTYLHAVKTSGQQRYNNLALAHLNANGLDSASFYLQKAFSSRAHNFKTTVNGLSWYYLGRLQESKKQYQQALRTYHRSIIELDPDFTDTSVTSNPEHFKGVHVFSDLFNAFTGKARVLRTLYTISGQLNFLEHSLKTWETALLLARTVQQGYEGDESRLFLNNNLQPASEEAAATALLLYKAQPSKDKLEKIFQLAETSKAAVLQIRLQQASADTLPGMPTALLKEQKRQQILLSRLQVQYETATDTVALQALQQQIRDLEISLSEVNQQLNADPKYSAARSATTDLKITDLQQNLPENMAMISYYFIPDHWLAFALRKDSLFLELLPADRNKEDLLKTTREQLSSTALSAAQLKSPVTSLHQWLIQPLLARLHNIHRLIIIPDHDLQSLPFEVLMNSNGKRLLDDYAISYDYSAVFFGSSGKQSAASKQLGVAPFIGSKQTVYRGNFAALPASAKEITAIKGDKLIDSMATKKAFMQGASSYSFIHLATHADANDLKPENSFIAFYPLGADTNYKLYQPEIYNLDLHKTQLVILSACETGRGQFVHGEGMMSLARAFSYAGCKSVITSLWKADDASTAYIMQRVHNYLQAGKTKDVALQQAKLDYLQDDAILARHKTPAYWSHLVLIGNTKPIYASSFSAWWIAAGSILLIGAITFLFLRKKRT